ncbi:MAG: diaminopimelate epimerase [Bacteroidetes bacterium]|nr:MAG: diaminopimelate epimerase [Bacteroidota bacterium]TAG88755.1 MAG: diaminopimelate epimerase [Bacteroidota bacterium]
MFSFHKYQGTGNDFIMIDDRNLQFPAHNHQLIQTMCDRRFGVGADGLILIQNTKGFDFRMIYFNANGFEGSMCGNGGRCAVAYAKTLQIFENKTYFLACDGEHNAFIEGQNIHLQMKNVVEIETNPNFYFLDTGSPHYVEWVENLEKYEVFEKGKNIRYNDRFNEKGTNVNFVEKINEKTIAIRTYERGVEDETYACGTGATACAMVASMTKKMPSPIDVKVLGGDLSVSFEVQNNQFSNVFLIGKAQKTFEGFFENNMNL